MQEPVNPELLASMQSQGAQTLSGTQRPKHINDAVPRIAPKWLKHDRQVSLRLCKLAGRPACESLRLGALPRPLVEINYYTLASGITDLNRSRWGHAD